MTRYQRKSSFRKINGGNRYFREKFKKNQIHKSLLQFPNLPFVYIKFGEQKHLRWLHNDWSEPSVVAVVGGGEEVIFSLHWNTINGFRQASSEAGIFIAILQTFVFFLFLNTTVHFTYMIFKIR